MQEVEPKGLIMVIGVLDKEGSTNIPMALSFMKQGFSVIPINYRTIISKYGYAYFSNLVMSLVTHEEPNLVLICKGSGIQPNLIAEITKHTKTWVYNMDPSPTIDMVPEVRESASIATFCSCTAYDMAEEWHKKYGANSFYMVQGLDEEIFRPRKLVKKYKADISLIGSKTPERDHYKELLENEGYKVKFYGRGYSDKDVLDAEFAKVCSSSKYMLSTDSIAGLHTQYFSNRLLRYLGCGACTLHLEPTGTLEENHFKDGEHLYYFKSDEELLAKLDILKSSEGRAYQLAMNGMDRVLAAYTWDGLMNILLSIALPDEMGVPKEEITDGVG